MSSTTASYISQGGGAYFHFLPTTTCSVGTGHGRSLSTQVPYGPDLLAVWSGDRPSGSAAGPSLVRIRSELDGVLSLARAAYVQHRMVPGGHETLQPSVQRHDRQRARDQDFRSSACISADVYMEPVSGFEPLTCRLQGAIGPSWTVAGRCLISQLPAPIVAVGRPTSVTACLRWLPIWLPAVGDPAVIGLHISGFAERSLNSQSRAAVSCAGPSRPPARSSPRPAEAPAADP